MDFAELVVGAGRAVRRPPRRRARRLPRARAAHPAGAHQRRRCPQASPAPARRRSASSPASSRCPAGISLGARARVRRRRHRASRCGPACRTTSPRSPTRRPRSPCSTASRDRGTDARAGAFASRPRRPVTRVDDLVTINPDHATMVAELEATIDEAEGNALDTSVIPTGDDLAARHRAVPARRGADGDACRAPEGCPGGAVHQPATASSFGANARLFDTTRPRYPDAFVDDVLPRSGPRASTSGAGTGLLGRSFRRARRRIVLGVELDAQMAELARPPRPRGRGVVVRGLGSSERTFDLLCRGQAWHWVEPAAARRKAAEVITPGGVVALVWNSRDGSATSRGARPRLRRLGTAHAALPRRHRRELARPGGSEQAFIAVGAFGDLGLRPTRGRSGTRARSGWPSSRRTPTTRSWTPSHALALLAAVGEA